MGNSTAYAAAEAALADIFTGILTAGGAAFASFERGALAEGHAIMARAMGRALERRDAALCADLPSRLRVHDVRERSLATTLGDVSFRWRRLRGRDGETVIPLADELDLPWGARVSPAAEGFLVEAGAEAVEVCGAGGTWVSPQGAAPGEPSKVEIKAMAAYSGKAGRGRKVAREHCVRHGCAAAPATSGPRPWPSSTAGSTSRRSSACAWARAGRAGASGAAPTSRCAWRSRGASTRSTSTGRCSPASTTRPWGLAARGGRQRRREGGGRRAAGGGRRRGPGLQVRAAHGAPAQP